MLLHTYMYRFTDPVWLWRRYLTCLTSRLYRTTCVCSTRSRKTDHLAVVIVVSGFEGFFIGYLLIELKKKMTKFHWNFK